MHAEGSAYAGSRDEALHEVGLLLLELCELVGHDEEVRHRLRYVAYAVVAQVGGDVHRGLASHPLRLIEHPLPACELRPERGQRAGHLRAVQVGDGTCQVREDEPLPREGGGEPASLVVDEDKGHLVGGIGDAQREYPGDDELALARPRGPGHKAVGAVCRLMGVQHERGPF